LAYEYVNIDVSDGEKLNIFRVGAPGWGGVLGPKYRPPLIVTKFCRSLFNIFSIAIGNTSHEKKLKLERGVPGTAGVDPAADQHASQAFSQQATAQATGITILPVKGTVSPDIAFYSRVCNFKPILSVRPFMVFKLIYFAVL
jgi:hypothetical protein